MPRPGRPTVTPPLRMLTKGRQNDGTPFFSGPPCPAQGGLGLGFRRASGGLAPWPQLQGQVETAVRGGGRAVS